MEAEFLMSAHDPCIAFGAKIRSLRESSGYSQEQFADIAGLDRTYISSVERGKRNVSLRNIIRLAEALSVHPRELFDP